MASVCFRIIFLILLSVHWFFWRINQIDSQRPYEFLWFREGILTIHTTVSGGRWRMLAQGGWTYRPHGLFNRTGVITPCPRAFCRQPLRHRATTRRSPPSPGNTKPSTRSWCCSTSPTSRTPSFGSLISSSTRRMGRGGNSSPTAPRTWLHRRCTLNPTGLTTAGTTSHLFAPTPPCCCLRWSMRSRSTFASRTRIRRHSLVTVSDIQLLPSYSSPSYIQIAMRE